MLPHREQTMIVKKGKGFEHLWKVIVGFISFFITDCSVILSNILKSMVIIHILEIRLKLLCFKGPDL